MIKRENIRNIAIIAHVDHGKTTLVDAMLAQSGTFRENEVVDERVMDSNDLERERGITILAKNTSLYYNGVKINIIDTPGHADFGGEVERGLEMVDGVLLLVDAFEGCMPQTRFVLSKALALDLRPIIVVNKVDRPNARPYEVVDEVLELFIDLGASEEQLDTPVIFASGRDGWATAEYSPEKQADDLRELFELIVREIPCPEGEEDGPFQMLVSNIDYDDYTGRIAVGKIQRGSIKTGMPLAICRADGKIGRAKATKLYTFEGLMKSPAEEVGTGDVVAISGIADINIGETVCDSSEPDPLPFVKIDDPVLSMTFSVNDSPFAGQDGKFVTSRQLRDRLYKELDSNVSLRVEDTDTTEAFKVSGRGELHLSVLIENMRREGYEFQVSNPVVIYKEIDGEKCEPIERLTVDIPEEYTGAVMDQVINRMGNMTNMTPTAQNYTRLEFLIPSRGLIGFRSEILTATKGTAIVNSILEGYEPYKGEFNTRNRGAVIAWEGGETITYGLYNAQDRGTLFVGPGVKVYEGMIVGECARNEDITINVCKKKHATNTRASGSDEALKLVPPKDMSLEQCLDFIADDELLEVTPHHLRMRKRILKTDLRAKEAARKKK
ncbi:MAG TPA: translational GTPase TypA [Candidatus Ornithomonoglobus merdipullorum]|uniref:Large ribosomal subunit assembly factor BipA n=1 Tax=Candidatus Ornithomonoglobus merdipullorum TaxID=2840895 RepID=A0A9D1MCX4_9FIRM|nr:translational GTPase TypA [Candidatus Ornithomonoglobus merdipullorum]